jgi:hypothetical protein
VGSTIPSADTRRSEAGRDQDRRCPAAEVGMKAAKSVNNILVVLSVMLKKAVEWGVIDQMPFSITLLPVPKGSTALYDFTEYERLVDAARSTRALS